MSSYFDEALQAGKYVLDPIVKEVLAARPRLVRIIVRSEEKRAALIDATLAAMAPDDDK